MSTIPAIAAKVTTNIRDSQPSPPIGLALPGPEARAWVLADDDGLAVTVTVRDDGIGFAHDRLAEAASAGRLGVAQAIVGRLRDVGGEASITSAPGQGTEVELRVRRG